MAQPPFSINTDYEARAKGYRGTATAGATTNVDLAIGAEDRYIDGVKVLLVNHAEADTIDFKVVDVDGVYAPAGTVLKQFGYAWNVDHERSDQGVNVYNFVAKILAGLYIRIAYTSTGATNVIIKVNARLFKKVS